MWEVEFTDEFEQWWCSLSEDEQVDIAACVGLIEEQGPQLGYPYSSGIKNSKHSRMRELRIQHDGKPIRVLYIFDPRRIAILLIGGDKTGQSRWYEKYISIADKLYDDHIAQLQSEGYEDDKEF